MLSKRQSEIFLGVLNIVLGLIFGIAIALIFESIISIGVIVFGVLPVVVGICLLIGSERFLDFRTSRIETLGYDGVVHSKDRSTHISGSSESVSSHNQYLVRIRTCDGFFDSYSKDAFLTYKEGDKVRISVTNRYNKKGKIFRQYTYIHGFSI